MPRVQLPSDLAHLLGGTHLDGPVSLALDRCSQFYGDPTRGLPFFPEYTDHGVSHFQSVLDATVGLMTPEALGVLTPEDAAVLTVSVLLHDAAMHLTPEGFLSLLDSPGPPVVPHLDSKTWRDQWNSYVAEASRWDGRRLWSVLGAVDE